MKREDKLQLLKVALFGFGGSETAAAQPPNSTYSDGRTKRFLSGVDPVTGKATMIDNSANMPFMERPDLSRGCCLVPVLDHRAQGILVHMGPLGKGLLNHTA